jgi:flagellar M-ring protein FliF
MQEFWDGLSRGARTGLVVGVVSIALMLCAASWWIFRTDYQVLFSDLKAQDAQAMTAELDRLKVPYRLGDSGTAILVDAASVHATRLKLMGKELPLQGAVGFELFNNTDFGMTEFAQKINYQRALQGELTRTILSLAEVREVRVHLALPEQGLFKQATARAKASITVALRQGEVLRAEQVVGIQRLVASAVPGMTIQDVTIVDNRGVALTRVATADGEHDSGGARLDLKRDMELYLSRKAAAVLDRVFGPGQALASVDVTLNMDQIRVTTEDVIPASGRTGADKTGVIVKERETLRDMVAPLDARNEATGRGSTNSQRDVDYAVGRRVEQVIGQPGSIRRVHVVAVVRKPLDAQQLDQVNRLLAAAVGAVEERGDAVVVQALESLVPAAAQPGALAQDMAMPAGPEAGLNTPAAVRESPAMEALWRSGLAALALVLLAVVAVSLLRRRAVRAPRASGPSSSEHLSDDQRAAALRQVQAWMRTGPASTQGVR